MKRLIYLCLITMSVACNEEIEKTIEINDKPELIVNALMDNKYDENIINLRMSGKYKTTPVEWATVDVYVNGEIKESVTSPSNQYTISTKFTDGDEIGLKVTTQDKKHVATATCKMPRRVKIEEVTISKIKKYRHEFSRYHIRIRKDTQGTTYYRLGLDADYQWYMSYGCVDGQVTFIEGYCNSSTSHYSYDSDMALTNGNPDGIKDNTNSIYKSESAKNYFAVFNSQFFKDDEYTIVVDIDDTEMNNRTEGQGWKRKSTIEIYSITEEEYYYLRALNMLTDYTVGSLTTSEPITGSNIEGGIGLLSASSVASVQYIDSTRHLTDNGFHNLKEYNHWVNNHMGKDEKWPCDCDYFWN